MSEHEWMRRTQAAEREARFAEAVERLRAAFEKNDSRTLEKILDVLRDMYVASERARESEAKARHAAESREGKMLILTVASFVVGVAGIIIGAIGLLA